MTFNKGIALITGATEQDVAIRELAGIVTNVVGFKGAIVFDASKPGGNPRKLLNVDRLRALGWQARTLLSDGIANACVDLLTMQLSRACISH